MITGTRTGQIVFIAENWDECSEYMYDRRSDGYIVSIMDYCKGYYFVVMDKGTTFNKQETLFSADFPSMEINDYWDKGLDITYVTADNMLWMIFFSAGAPNSGQEWFLRQEMDDIRKVIRDIWDQGKSITDFRKTSEGILLVMSGGMGYQQLWVMNKELPEDKIIKAKKDNDAVITHIADFDGYYFVVLSSETGISKQKVYRTRNFATASKEVDENWKQGMFVTSGAFINNELTIVFSR